MSSSVACPALQYFSTLFKKDPIFENKKVIELTMCLDFPYHFCLKLVSFYEELNEIVKNAYWYSSKIPLILVIF